MKATLRIGRPLGAGALIAGLLAAGCASTEPARNVSAANPLVGTWRLVSFQMEHQGSGEKTFPMGRTPAGYLSFMADGRTAVVITGEGRKAPSSDAERAALYNSLVAYTGAYRIEGDQWITSVDASANPAWVGTQQPRSFKVNGDTLQETTPWFPRADKTMIRVFNTYTRLK